MKEFRIGRAKFLPEKLTSIAITNMKLNWIRLFERIDDDLLEEQYVEREHGFVKRGRRYAFCHGCNRWVEESSYRLWCQNGVHEYAEEADLDKELIPEVVKRLSETQI